ncbi:MAG: VanZ family protein [Betaproteobacteria bacterium]|nr:VanZ family protein [Betaproteobacteria bacterium]
MTLPPVRTARGYAVRSRLLTHVSLLVYVILIIAGSLYPYTGWRVPPDNAMAFLIKPWPRFITHTDTITNVLAYLPLGFLLSRTLRRSHSALGALLLATEGGAILSLMMETAQAFIPVRDASTLDIATNTCGSLLGALFHMWSAPDRFPGRFIARWRARWFLPGTGLGLSLLGLWALSQLGLQAPALITCSIPIHLTPMWETLRHPVLFQPQQAVIFMLEITSLGLFTATLLKPGREAAPALVVLLLAMVVLKFLAAAAFLKLAMLGRLISLEAVSGLGGGILLLVVLLRRGERARPAWAMAMLATFVLAEAAYRLGDPQAPNILPFIAPVPERLFNIAGLAYILSDVWPVLALVYLATRRSFRET